MPDRDRDRDDRRGGYSGRGRYEEYDRGAYARDNRRDDRAPPRGYDRRDDRRDDRRAPAAAPRGAPVRRDDRHAVSDRRPAAKSAPQRQVAAADDDDDESSFRSVTDSEDEEEPEVDDDDDDYDDDDEDDYTDEDEDDYDSYDERHNNRTARTATTAARSGGSRAAAPRAAAPVSRSAATQRQRTERQPVRATQDRRYAERGRQETEKAMEARLEKAVERAAQRAVDKAAQAAVAKISTAAKDRDTTRTRDGYDGATSRRRRRDEAETGVEEAPAKRGRPTDAKDVHDVYGYERRKKAGQSTPAQRDSRNAPPMYHAPGSRDAEGWQPLNQPRTDRRIVHARVGSSGGKAGGPKVEYKQVGGGDAGGPKIVRKTVDDGQGKTFGRPGGGGRQPKIVHQQQESRGRRQPVVEHQRESRQNFGRHAGGQRRPVVQHRQVGNNFNAQGGGGRGDGAVRWTEKDNKKVQEQEAKANEQAEKVRAALKASEDPVAAVGGVKGLVAGMSYTLTPEVEKQLTALSTMYTEKGTDVIVALTKGKGGYKATVKSGGKEVSSDFGARIDGSSEDPVGKAINNAIAFAGIQKPKPKSNAARDAAVDVDEMMDE